jgi:hypothetical protein
MTAAPKSVIRHATSTFFASRAGPATFRGVARCVVVASSQDVYRWGYVIGKDGGPVDSHITEDSPLRESRYPYRGRKLPIYTEWDIENYNKILVERAFPSNSELPAITIGRPSLGPRPCGGLSNGSGRILPIRSRWQWSITQRKTGLWRIRQNNRRCSAQ